MSDFDAIDSLLASVTPEAELPAPPVRRELREQAHLSKAQAARALGVSPSTLAAWEAGREPAGEVRAKYVYLLDGLAAKLAAAAEEAAPPVTEAEAEVAPSPVPGTAVGDDADDVELLTEPELCVLCGEPAVQRVAGFPQHLDAAECGVPVTRPQPEPVAPQSPKPDRHASRTSGSTASTPPARRAFQPSSEPVDLIGRSVRAAIEAHGGDVAAATAALVKKAIPDAMALLDATRKGGRYDVIAHPWMPDILKKQSSRGADQVWEARPKWTRAELPPGEHGVTALDINGAYLSALKTHLPLGQLEHSTGFDHDRRRAGVHLITPPSWDHEDVLPNPVGQRDEPGPLWVTEPTLRLLLRLSGPKHGLCEPPEIHESFTSGATEGLLEKFRIALKDARDTAIATDDEVTLEYVKAMYSKFVSTMGESNYNRELYRPDWMHLIRSQAFANLWMKALKAHDEGLTVVRAMGTDELHVIGDWRKVFPEGRGVAEVKVKDEYAAGTANLAGEEG
ncbi:helix-turn-helix domain-containing protein [Streptomyces sp. NBC_01433]|uniref:helix-turn-helix domain-containing protein n=1 Tax=Streptomyces sp. NBC_01433 TaxID=2903864 RepID=UPI00225958F3|nr:helix-turn-helix transcriptional regulator [Streptomyces sp. NBC_01433]MCX4681752.1 helix-turn-helix domain-containing protein [Streptomyces sp. NBC_01433]